MSSLRFRLKITLLSPLHIGTGSGLAGLLDAQTVRGFGPNNSEIPLPYLPASSLKGRLRWQLGELAAALKINVCPVGQRCSESPPCPGCLLFGAPDREGILQFEDAHLMEPEWALATFEQGAAQPFFLTSTRHFVALSRVRRIARPQQLAAIEQVDRGSAFEVRGAAHFVAPYQEIGPLLPGGAPAPRAMALLVAAAQMLTHLGGQKARGLGRIATNWLQLEYEDQPVAPESALRALRSWQEGQV